MVADTSDEDSNLPDDPLDLDEEMAVPQRPTIQDLYKKTKGSGGKSGAGPAAGDKSASLHQEGGAEAAHQVQEEGDARTARMAAAEEDVTVRCVGHPSALPLMRAFCGPKHAYYQTFSQNRRRWALAKKASTP